MKLEQLELIKNAWLEQFPKDRRSTVINWMLQNSAEKLLRKRQYYGPEDTAIINTIVRDMEEIPGTIALVRQFYELNREERLKPKVPLTEQLPTEKQLNYLRILGCKEIPGNKKRAMELISERITK